MASQLFWGMAQFAVYESWFIPVTASCQGEITLAGSPNFVDTCSWKLFSPEAPASVKFTSQRKVLVPFQSAKSDCAPVMVGLVISSAGSKVVRAGGSSAKREARPRAFKTLTLA